MPPGFAFEAPEWLNGLWWLPVLVILYLFRRRARRILVPFLPFWQRVFAEKRRRPSLVRTLFSILLQMLAAASVLLALARPYREESRAEPAPSVVVLDRTLGTSMTSAEGTLADAVVARGRTVFGRAAAEGPVSLALLRGGLEPVAAASRAGNAWWEGLPPPSGTRDLDPLRTLARAVDPDTRVFFVTPFETPAVDLPGVTVLSAARGPLANGGIRGVILAGDGSLSVAVSSGGVERTLRLIAPDGTDLAAAPVPPALSEVRLKLPPGCPGEVTLRLAPPDAFPADDFAPLELPEGKLLRVLVASDEPTPALDSALVASSIMDQAGSGRVPLAQLGAVAEGFDVTIVVGAAAPVDLPPGRHLLVATFARGVPLVAGLGSGEARAVRKTDVPWLRALDLEEWRINRMGTTVAEPGLEVLVEGTRGPIVARFEGGGLRVVALAVRPDLASSTLPLLPAFPLMLRGALLDLAPRAAAAGVIVHRAGGRVVLTKAEAAAFAAEDGTPRPLEIARDGGGYELPAEPGRWSAGARRFATAWLDHPALPGEARASDDPWPATPRRTERRSFQAEALLVVIAVLLLEWCSYHAGWTD